MQLAQLLIFLILFPLIAAFFLLLAKKDIERDWIVKLSALVIGVVSVYLLITTYDKGALLVSVIPAEPTGLVMFILEMLIAVFILYLGITHKKWLVVGLILVQSVMMLYFELVYAHAVHVQSNLFIDEFSNILALIIGIIGSLICVYSLGYMKFFHEHHPEMPDRRTVVLCDPVRLPCSDVRAGLLQQYHLGLLLLGSHHPLFLPPDRVHEDRGSNQQCIQCPLDEPARRCCVCRCNHLPCHVRQRYHGTRRTARIRKSHCPHPGSPHRVCRAHQGSPAPVLLMACRGNGGTDPGLGPPPLQHDGQGRCLYYCAACTDLPGHLHRVYDRNGGSPHLPDRIRNCHIPEQCKTGACLLHDRKPRSHRCLCRYRDLRGDLGSDPPDRLPRDLQVAPLPLGRNR